MFDWVRKQIGRIQDFREQKARQRLELLKWRYQIFRSLLYENTRAVELITDIDLKLRETEFFGPGLQRKIHELIDVTGELAEKINQLDADRHKGLFKIHRKLEKEINELLKKIPTYKDIPLCISLDDPLPDCASFAGGKACTLSHLKTKGKFNIPQGFSILANSCRLFLEESGLSMTIMKKLQPFLFQNRAITPEVEEEIRSEVMAAPLPQALEDAIRHMSSHFFEKGSGLAVRSSALSEDGKHHSFAGQFTSVLNVVSLPELYSAVKEVIASNFNARSLAYRIGAGMKPLDFNMAVLCIEMVNANKAGVVFTLDPNDPAKQSMLISAVYGMGELVVAGASMADVYKPLRNNSSKYREKPVISTKVKRLVPDQNGGLKEEPVPADQQNDPVLTQEEIDSLVKLCLDIEIFLGSPQDIEWAIDSLGSIWIVQSRPLILEKHSGPASIRRDHRTPIFKEGLITSKGIVTGKVRLIRSRKDLSKDFAEPTILVLNRSMVDAAKVMSKIAGILVDYGNPADHLSCVAREYGRPMLVGLASAMERLEEGQWITIDAEEGKVYAAFDEEIKSAKEEFEKRENLPAAEKENGRENTVIDKLKNLTIKLNLTDAYGPAFSILECQSLHDIVRYVHEKAVLAFFEAGDELFEETSGLVFKLKSDIPFFLNIIDLGGGLAPRRKKKRSVTVNEITSRPFKALWNGIATPGLRWSGPPPVVGDVSSVMGRWMSDARSGRALGMPNYVIITRDYLNLNARMDFHFTMVDTVCSINSKENYVKFRFKGGGTNMTQRHRRALAIGEILERADFFTDVKGDLVNGAFNIAPAETIEEKLIIVGRLLGFTRLIDAAMYNDETPFLVADAFYEGDYELKKIVEYLEEQERKRQA